MNMKETEDELIEKVNFLSGFVALFKQQILTDIQLIPGNEGPPIAAHRALLVSVNPISQASTTF